MLGDVYVVEAVPVLEIYRGVVIVELYPLFI